MKPLIRMSTDEFDRRAPHGARGLKPLLIHFGIEHSSRAPHGARGLKLNPGHAPNGNPESRPARGAWIETHEKSSGLTARRVAPRTGRVD